MDGSILADNSGIKKAATLPGRFFRFKPVRRRTDPAERGDP
jgi:hypothetical protein